MTCWCVILRIIQWHLKMVLCQYLSLNIQHADIGYYNWIRPPALLTWNLKWNKNCLELKTHFSLAMYRAHLLLLLLNSSWLADGILSSVSPKINTILGITLSCGKNRVVWWIIHSLLSKLPLKSTWMTLFKRRRRELFTSLFMNEPGSWRKYLNFQ